MIRLCLILLFAALPIASKNVKSLVSDVLRANPRVHWGIYAVELKTGKVVANVNADQFFIPASNMKLFSTAFALTVLGPERRFVTKVLAAAPIAAGRVEGDLILYGGGDPSFSARRYPYNRDKQFEEDRLLPLRELARQLKDRGVTSVGGGIVGDDSYFAFDPIPNGWSVDDPIFEYGAPVSALSFNDNIFALKIGAEGAALDPPVEYFALLNEVGREAGKPRSIKVDRQPGSRILKLFGNLPPGAKDYANDFSADDPALFAAACFRQVLLQEGIRVDGPAAARHEAPRALESEELAKRVSPPLTEILQVTDKVSQNLHAEMVLRAAQKEMPLADFIKQVGIDAKDVNLEDGSGMSRLTLVTPRAVVQLLDFMRKTGNLEVFRGFLPQGTEDGTLRSRFANSPAGKQIRAKTGSLSHVSALGGYAESRRRGTIAFQIVANNYNAPTQEVRAAIDRIALALLQ